MGIRSSTIAPHSLPILPGPSVVLTRFGAFDMLPNIDGASGQTIIRSTI